MITIKYKDFTILIGETQKDNQSILDDAGPDDYWVHVSDYSSAHGLVQNPDGVRISPKILKQCCHLVKQKTNKCKSMKKLKFDVTKIKHLTMTDTPGQVHVELLMRNIYI